MHHKKRMWITQHKRKPCCHRPDDNAYLCTKNRNGATTWKAQKQSRTYTLYSRTLVYNNTPMHAFQCMCNLMSKTLTRISIRRRGGPARHWNSRQREHFVILGHVKGSPAARYQEIFEISNFAPDLGLTKFCFKRIFLDTTAQPKPPAHISQQSDGRIPKTIVRIQSRKPKRDQNARNLTAHGKPSTMVSVWTACRDSGHATTKNDATCGTLRMAEGGGRRTPTWNLEIVNFWNFEKLMFFTFFSVHRNEKCVRNSNSISSKSQKFIWNIKNRNFEIFEILDHNSAPKYHRALYKPLSARNIADTIEFLIKNNAES